MDQREDVLRQALDKNADETDRWQAFKEDNVNTIKNLDTFVKQQTVDIMVPIGNKALMAGQLIHTNELLVSHYEGYFSTCSAHKAKEICTHRLALAEKNLKELETEADLWQNKLQTPIREGAVPNSDEIEIVEDYDEESHKKWLEEHKHSVRKEKKEERLEREAIGNAKDDEILKKLEEREMLEELGLVSDDLNEDALRNMLSSETEPQPTPTSPPQTISDEREVEMWAKLEAQEREEILEMDDNEENSLKSTDEMVRQLISGEMDVPSEKKRLAKGENHVENHDLKEESSQEADEPEEPEEVPEEVQTLRALVDRLPREDHEAFLREQLQVFKAKMRKIKRLRFIPDELTHLINVVVALEDDLQELIFEREMETSSEDNVSEGEAIAAEPIPEPETRKRHISFALVEQKLEFRKQDAVADMLPKNKRKNQPQHPRKVITLDMPETKPGKANSNSHIMQKVEQNIELVQEQQSIQDFDLVNQILDGMTGRINTLHINFIHSNAEPAERDVSSTDKVDIPGTPADFYRIYERSKARAENQFPIYVNGFEGEEEVKVALLGEAARETAYEDPKTQMTKSILRNKSAVEREPHMTNPTMTNQNQYQNQKKKWKKNKKKRTSDDQLREMSAYKKVMSDDLVEKEPEGKFVETHAPRRRISRFKEQRAALK